MSGSKQLRTVLQIAFVCQIGLVTLVILPDQLFSGVEFNGFSGVTGFVEILLCEIPFLLIVGVQDRSRPSWVPLKKFLVLWASVSLVLAGCCIIEGVVFDHGLLRALWSYVYIIPACLSLYYAGRLRKW